MVPVNFPGTNAVLGKNQPNYRPLPAFIDEDGTVVTCWQLSFWERVKLLFTGRFYLVTLTFRQPLQPLLPSVANPLTDKPDTQ